MSVGSKGVFLMSKQREMNELCVDRCLGQSLGQALSIREQNCLNYCTTKVINAYSLMYDVIENNGLARNDDALRMKGPL